MLQRDQSCRAKPAHSADLLYQFGVLLFQSGNSLFGIQNTLQQAGILGREQPPLLLELMHRSSKSRYVRFGRRSLSSETRWICGCQFFEEAAVLGIDRVSADLSFSRQCSHCDPGGPPFRRGLCNKPIHRLPNAALGISMTRFMRFQLRELFCAIRHRLRDLVEVLPECGRIHRSLPLPTHGCHHRASDVPEAAHFSRGVPPIPADAFALPQNCCRWHRCSVF